MKNDNDKVMSTLDDFVNGFRKNFEMGALALKKAACCYAQALQKHPALAAERFSQEFPGVSNGTWDILERIGSGELNVKAFYLPQATARRIARIPPEDQEKLFASGVKGFKVVSPSTLKERIVPLQALSDAQVRLLFDADRGRVRSVQEQRDIINRQTQNVIKTMKRGRPVKYEIQGNICIIGGVEIGLNTLKAIVREMEQNLARRN